MSPLAILTHGGLSNGIETTTIVCGIIAPAFNVSPQKFIFSPRMRFNKSPCTDIEAECQDDYMKIRIGFNGSFTGLLYSAGNIPCGTDRVDLKPSSIMLRTLKVKKSNAMSTPIDNNTKVRVTTLMNE